MNGAAVNGSATEEPEELRAQLEDLQQALAAIRDGDVDALVPGGASGQQLYSHVSADRPYRVIVEEMGEGALTVSENGVVLYANRRLAELVGADRTSLPGRDVVELVDPVCSDLLASLLTATPGTTRHGELSLRTARRNTVPVLASVTGLQIEGAVVRCLIAADLSDRRRAEQRLAAAHAELTRSAAELEEAQRIGSIGSWHWDATTDELSWSTQMHRIAGIDPAPDGLNFRAALSATHPEDAPRVSEAFSQALANQQPFEVEHRLVHPDGETRHAVTRGEVLRDPDGRGHRLRGTTQDVTEQRRAAADVVQAREALVRRTMQLALEHRVRESLQRAVLPARLPSVTGVELAARYLPADRPAVVGGDWYDAFRLPGDGLAVAVGDVVGHDLDAAAAMGQLRNALRAYALSGRAGAVSGEPPDTVLARLNQLTADLDDGGLATALLGHLGPGGRSFRWASAGHPPPLLIGQAGVRLLPGVPGRMLGVRPDTAFGSATTALRTGDVLLLYTDGLIERRDRDLDEGFAALAEAAADLVGEPAETVCAALVDRLLPHQDTTTTSACSASVWCPTRAADHAHDPSPCLDRSSSCTPPHSGTR